MSKNLKSKAANLIDDIYSLTRSEAIEWIESFVQQELEFHKSDQYVDDQELTLIASNAAHEMTYMNMETVKDLDDDSKRRAYCFLNAVCAELRRRKLIGFQIKYKKKKPSW